MMITIPLPVVIERDYEQIGSLQLQQDRLAVGRQVPGSFSDSEEPLCASPFLPTRIIPLIVRRLCQNRTASHKSPHIWSRTEVSTKKSWITGDCWSSTSSIK